MTTIRAIFSIFKALFSIIEKGQRRPSPSPSSYTPGLVISFSVPTFFKTCIGRENSCNNLYLEKLLELDIILKSWILITNKQDKCHTAVL